MTKLYPMLVFVIVVYCAHAQWPHSVELGSVSDTATSAEDQIQGFFRSVAARIGLPG